MAATVPEYVDFLLRRQISAAGQLGVQLLLVDRQAWAINLTQLILIGTVMKALNDHNVVLDAEWQTRLNSALTGTWPDWIVNQTAPTS